MVEEIKKWALDNYDAGGHWIIECMTDDEIAAQFKSLGAAKRHVKLINERQRDCLFE